jgi:signal transduction histidine kinase
MSNAVKFSPKGSAVEVSCELKDQAVRIAVTDHGPGVPEAFRSRIFQKFAQADSGDTRQRGGTGLGLSICKAIVDKLGGTIGYQSAPGHGATFFLDLPFRT